MYLEAADAPDTAGRYTRNMKPAELSASTVRDLASRLGFDLCRIAAPRSGAVHTDYLEAWLEEGCHGDMAWLARNPDIRMQPDRLLVADSQPVRSLVVLGVGYLHADLPEHVRRDPSRGIFARYAWHEDYHDQIKPRLFELDALVRKLSGRTAHARCWVDTGPVVERDWAMASGLAFTGKNCCSINPDLGSWIFLAVLAIPEAIAPDPAPAARPPAPTLSPIAILDGLPHDRDLGTWVTEGKGKAEQTMTCGRCTRCLDQCPTDAFRGPLMLDARRCISYWTIEAKGPVPRDLRGRFGNLVFGCDVCQEVCPWNHERTPGNGFLADRPVRTEWTAPKLLEGFGEDNPYWLDDAAFRIRFRRSAVKRAKRPGMLRNVCTALGNWGAPAALPALARALREDSPPVREHAVWALGQLMRKAVGPDAATILQVHRDSEHNPGVREELATQLDG